ncbi:hypothetical protein HDE_11557 [Halotydeus destructor]|nr:hypothetical protein HDE_11557 [Halotydeus destructor]
MIHQMPQQNAIVTMLNGYSVGQKEHISGQMMSHQQSSHSINGSRFLGLFTAAHGSICLLIAGFGMLVIGLLSIVGSNVLQVNDVQDKLKLEEARSVFRTVGITVLVMGVFLLFLSIVLFVTAIKWARHRVYAFRTSPATGLVQPQIQLHTLHVPAYVHSQYPSQMPGSTMELSPQVQLSTDPAPTLPSAPPASF